ncbi:hypothetical protein VTJ04DRAFT_10094 [Mycothermus thermophilus]|uniref:uncharacterized protein n=1 Tax=Humicola insolens TaxID=85995 RepID=UPI0037422B32
MKKEGEKDAVTYAYTKTTWTFWRRWTCLLFCLDVFSLHTHSRRAELSFLVLGYGCAVDFALSSPPPPAPPSPHHHHHHHHHHYHHYHHHYYCYYSHLAVAINFLVSTTPFILLADHDPHRLLSTHWTRAQLGSFAAVTAASILRICFFDWHCLHFAF